MNPSLIEFTSLADVLQTEDMNELSSDLAIYRKAADDPAYPEWARHSSSVIVSIIEREISRRGQR